jgi:hypothetical protein
VFIVSNFLSIQSEYKSFTVVWYPMDIGILQISDPDLIHQIARGLRLLQDFFKKQNSKWSILEILFGNFIKHEV